MAVGTASLELVSTLDETTRQRFGVGDDLTCVLLPLGLGSLEERRCDGSNGLPEKVYYDNIAGVQIKERTWLCGPP